MKPITIYTKSWCPYCADAKALLAKKNAAFEEVDVDGNGAATKAMMTRSGRSSVPQIFIGGQHVGGCDDLYALERDGKLDALLAE